MQLSKGVGSKKTGETSPSGRGAGSDDSASMAASGRELASARGRFRPGLDTQTQFFRPTKPSKALLEMKVKILCDLGVENHSQPILSIRDWLRLT